MYGLCLKIEKCHTFEVDYNPTTNTTKKHNGFHYGTLNFS